MDGASSDIRASIAFSGKSEEFVSIGNDLDWQKRMGREKILKTAGSETKIQERETPEAFRSAFDAHVYKGDSCQNEVSKL